MFSQVYIYIIFLLTRAQGVSEVVRNMCSTMWIPQFVLMSGVTFINLDVYNILIFFQSSIIRINLFLLCTFSLHRWYIWHVSSESVLTFNFSYCFWISYTSSPLHGRGYPHKTVLNSHLWWRAGLNIFQCIFYNFRVTSYCTCLENLLTTLFSDVIQYVY